MFVQYSDGGRAQVAPIAGSNQELTDLVRLLAARASSQERRFDYGSPAVNLQLPGGERLFAVMGLTADAVTSLSIRRHGYLTVILPELRARGTIDAGLEQLLRAMVRARKNTLITGGTGAGKTTLLRAMAYEMDLMERIVTIEDAFELGLELDPAMHADVTAFQAREANVEGEGVVSQAELDRRGSSHPGRHLNHHPDLTHDHATSSSASYRRSISGGRYKPSRVGSLTVPDRHRHVSEHATARSPSTMTAVAASGTSCIKT